jgi:hypothetical protein
LFVFFRVVDIGSDDKGEKQEIERVPFHRVPLALWYGA